MSKVIAWIKGNPLMAGGIALAVALVAYLLSKSSSSSGTGGQFGLSSTDAAFLQTQAGVQAAALQSGTQVQMAQLQAQTQSQQIAAAQDIANQQTAAQVSIAGIQGTTAQDLATTQAGVQEYAIGNQAQVYSQAISAQQELNQQQQQFAQSTLAYLPNIGGSQNRLALIQSALGQPNAAIATQVSEGQIQSQPSWFAQFLGGLTGGVARVAGGLFGGGSSALGALPPTTQQTVSAMIPTQSVPNINFSLPASYGG